jgi:dimethylargininase
VRIALTREVSPNLGRCELTHLERQPIDIDLARTQHHNYEICLARLGYDVRHVPAAPELPDSVFIEDTCVVLPELAVIARPGADSRRPETVAVAESMRQYRPLQFIEAPGTLDGGDVLRIGRKVFAGMTGRTNEFGFEQLRSFLSGYGYFVIPVGVKGCLHLKSAVTAVSQNTILVNPAHVEPGIFRDLHAIEVDPFEPPAANALLIDKVIVYPTAYPRTRIRLEKIGIEVISIDLSELSKAEGAVTCCSVLIDDFQ